MRLAMYRKFRGKVPAGEQYLAEVYAEATYLKYRSARDIFQTSVSSLEQWRRLRAEKQEALALFEAWNREPAPQLVGAMLLRSAWTGDIVVDFVGTNFGATKYAMPILSHVGTMLICVALDVGIQSEAKLVWAETARHSSAWWNRLLAGGKNFIKVRALHEAHKDVVELLESANVTLIYTV